MKNIKKRCKDGRCKSDEVWYVARVRIGAEENVKRRCLEQISSEVVKECYVFHYEEKRHIYGEWITQEKILFPGYVFLVGEEVQAEKINEELYYIKGVIKLLRIDDKTAMLTDEEVELLRTFGGCEQKVKMSKGIIEWSKVRIFSGPLVGKEKYIKKIDRHKRRAELEMPLLGNVQRVQVGLEIVSKI